MKRVLFIIAFALLQFAAFSQKPITNFEDLMKALGNGKEVKAVFHYAKCQLISDNEIEDRVPDAIGGFTIDVFEHFAKGAVYNKEAFVVASTYKLIKNPIGDGYVYNYAKVRVDANNKVKISAIYVDPVSFEENMSENFFTEIKTKDNDAGASFFIVD